MEIKINVDEVKFKDVIEKELNAFSKEELHEIIRECIIESLHNDKTLKDLFVVEKKDYWGHSLGIDPSNVMIEAARSIDLSPAYTEIKDKMIETLKTDYRSILEKAMLGLILNGISNDYEFQNRMSSAIELAINKRVNN